VQTIYLLAQLFAAFIGYMSVASVERKTKKNFHTARSAPRKGAETGLCSGGKIAGLGRFLRSCLNMRELRVCGYSWASVWAGNFHKLSNL